MDAPDAFNVVEEPLQIDRPVDEAVTTGSGFTVIVLVVDAVHPWAFVAVTVYVPLVVTLRVAPVVPPGCQRYVDPPVAVIVAV